MGCASSGSQKRRRATLLGRSGLRNIITRRTAQPSVVVVVVVLLIKTTRAPLCWRQICLVIINRRNWLAGHLGGLTLKPNSGNPQRIQHHHICWPSVSSSPTEQAIKDPIDPRQLEGYCDMRSACCPPTLLPVYCRARGIPSGQDQGLLLLLEMD